jgi:hypothetical protein
MESKMSGADVADSVSHWPYLPTPIRLALAVGCGAFVGPEREHHGKAGARTFGLATFAGLSRRTIARGLCYPFVGLFGCNGAVFLTGVN